MIDSQTYQFTGGGSAYSHEEQFQANCIFPIVKLSVSSAAISIQIPLVRLLQIEPKNIECIQVYRGILNRLIIRQNMFPQLSCFYRFRSIDPVLEAFGKMGLEFQLGKGFW